MLRAMRSAARYTWIFLAVAFVGGFLLYESSGLFGRAPVTSTTAVATVNGEDILVTTWQQLSQQLEQQQTQSTGQSVSLDERQALEDRAYNQLVDDALLRQELRRRAIGVSDDELVAAAKFSPPPQLMQDPELQTNGQFDLAKYQRFLASPTAKQSGLLVQLENLYRTEIPKQKLFEQVTAGIWPSDALLWMSYKDAHDSAQVTFAALRPTEQQIAAQQVSDNEIRAYYDTHKKELTRPGHAVVTYTHIARTVSAADSAAVRAHAVALRDRIMKGEKFEDIAKSESVDSTSAVRGGDLGRGPLGRFVPAFENAAKSLTVGEVSQPVLTPFGYHLIRLDTRNGDTLALHHILLRITQSDSAADRTDRKADSLSKMAASATDHPEHFDAAVRQLGLTATRANVTEGQPLVSNGEQVPSVSAWAFSGAKPGETSDLFDDESGYYLARLESVTPGGVPSLDQVKTEIRTYLAHQKAVQALAEPAQKLATAAAASSLDQAGSVLNTPVQKTGYFTRLSGLPNVPGSERLVGAAFTLPLHQVSAPIVGDDAVFVAVVDNRTEADRKAFDAQKSAERQQILGSLQQSRIREFLANLRESAKITDRRKDIKEAMRATSS